MALCVVGLRVDCYFRGEILRRSPRARSQTAAVDFPPIWAGAFESRWARYLFVVSFEIGWLTVSGRGEALS